MAHTSSVYEQDNAEMDSKKKTNPEAAAKTDAMIFG